MIPIFSFKKLPTLGLITCAVFSSSLANAAAENNMVEDSGFEKGSPYWRLWVPDEYKTMPVFFDLAPGEGENNSIAAKVSAEFFMRASVGGKRFAVVPKQQVQVAFSYRVSAGSTPMDRQPGVVLRFSFFDASGATRLPPVFLSVDSKVSAQLPGKPDGPLSETWKRVTREVVIPDNAGLADVALFIWGFQGVAFFDNVSVTPLP